MDERDENLELFRQRIRNNLNINKYNPNDLHRADNENWWLESFLNSRSGDLDVASAVFFECLKWRQNFNVHSISLLELRPLLEKSFIYFHGNDVEENRLLWINFKNFTPNNQLNEKLFVFWMEHHVVDTENQPMAIFLNFHETTSSSMDIHFVKFMFHCLKYYYPNCMRQIYVFELPLKLSAPWRLITSYLDVSTYSSIVTLNSRNISTYIPLKAIPRQIGGENDYKFKLNDLARCTGSPMVRLRRFSHPISDRKLSNSDKDQLRKRSVKFDINSTLNANDVNIFNRTIDWQHRNFMAIAPKRSLILNQTPSNNPPTANLILQSMSSWNVYFEVGINSRRQIEITPNKGLLDPNGRAIISVKVKNGVKISKRYKIEVLTVRLREVPDDLDDVEPYSEPAEDRVKFFYDCYVNVPKLQNVEKKETTPIEPKPKEEPLVVVSKDKQKWSDQQFWPIIIVFDVLLVLIVIYIYS